MNSKAIAVIMAVAMAVVGFSVAIADDSEAYDLNKVVVEVNGTDASTVVGINEGNYTEYKYTLVWKLTVNKDSETMTVKDSINNSSTNATIYVTSDGVQTTDEGASFSLSMTADNTDIGKYNITIQGITKTDDKISYILEPTITVKTDGGSKTFTNFAKFEGSVSVIAKKASGQISIGLSEVKNAQIGKYYENSIVFTKEDANMVVSDYDWYASGLPAGLTMANNGTISGIPTDKSKVSVDKPIYIYATDKSGNMYYGTITQFQIADKDSATEANGFGYYINDADNGANKATYLFSPKDIGKDGIKLYLTNDEGTLITDGTALDGYTVKVIGDTGISNDLASVGGSYSLPSTGSGAYKVTITDDDTKNTAVFTVYIIGEASDITASIVIEGA